MSRDLYADSLSLIIAGACGITWLSLGGCVGFCCIVGATLGFGASLGTTLGFVASFRVVSGNVFIVFICVAGGTLGCCTVACLVRNDIMVGSCCFVCGACLNAFHRDHSCSRILYLFASVGRCVSVCLMVLLRSWMLALSVSSAVGSSNFMLL